MDAAEHFKSKKGLDDISLSRYKERKDVKSMKMPKL